MRGSLAIVIPTRDRAGDLGACLAAIATQAPGWLAEVVVVDDGSRTPVRLDGEPCGSVPVRLIRNEEARGAAVARNRALGTISADAIAFLDDDSRIAPAWFDAIDRELLPGRAAITGWILPLEDSIVALARQQRYERRYAGLRAGEEVDFLLGGNSVVWRHALLAAGAFPETPTMSDSLLVAELQRAGGGCHFAPSLIVHHRHSKGLASAVTQAWRAGRVSAGWQRPLPAEPAAGRARGRGRAARALNLGLQLTFRAGRLAPARAECRDQLTAPVPEGRTA